jgi:hypothetical protein
LPRIPKWDLEHYRSLVSDVYHNPDKGGLDDIDADTAPSGSAETLELGDDERVSEECRCEADDCPGEGRRGWMAGDGWGAGDGWLAGSS